MAWQGFVAIAVVCLVALAGYAVTIYVGGRMTDRDERNAREREAREWNEAREERERRTT
jgi:hypothetical protein